MGSRQERGQPKAVQLDGPASLRRWIPAPTSSGNGRLALISSSYMNAAVHTSIRVHRRRDDVPGSSASASPPQAAGGACRPSRRSRPPRGRRSCRRVGADFSMNTSGTCGASQADPDPSVLGGRAEDERMSLSFMIRRASVLTRSVPGALGHRARGRPWCAHWFVALFPSRGRAE